MADSPETRDEGLRRTYQMTLPDLSNLADSTAAARDAADVARDQWPLIERLANEAPVWAERGLAAVGGPVGVAGFSLAAGIIAWLWGGRLVRPGMATVGILAGAAVGTLAMPAVLGPRVGAIPTEIVGFASGALIGALAGLLLFRAAMAVIGATAFGLAAFTAALLYVGAPAHGALDGAREARAYLESRTTAQDDGVVITLDNERAQARVEPLAMEAGWSSAGARLNAAAQDVAVRTRAWWEAQPTGTRSVLTLWAGIGLMFGAAAGVIAPRRIAAAVTSGVGAAVMLGAGSVILQAQRPQAWQELAEHPNAAAGLVVGWIALTAMGTVRQVRAMKRASRPAVATPTPAAPGERPAAAAVPA